MSPDLIPVMDMMGNPGGAGDAASGGILGGMGGGDEDEDF